MPATATTRRPHPPGLISTAALLGLAACATGPAFAPEEMSQVRDFQAAVRAVQRCSDAELFTERLLLTLPEGLGLHLLDLHGKTGHGAWHHADGSFTSVIVCIADGVQTIPWSGSFPHPEHVRGEFARYCTEHAEGGWFLACGGAALCGFDDVLMYTLGGDGVTLAGVRHGTPCLIAGDHVSQGEVFNPTFRPQLSFDGRRIAFARWRLLGSQPFWAATDDPADAAPLPLPGVLAWPPVLSRDGSRWGAKFTAGREQLAVENGEVLARFDELDAPLWYQEADVFVWKGRRDGTQRLLIGRTLTEPFDEVAWPTVQADGRWRFVGRDAAGLHVVADGVRVSDHHGKTFTLGAGSTAGAAQWVQGDDGIRIVVDGRTCGPYPPDPGVTIECVSDDGRSVAFRLGAGRTGSFLVDGVRVGAEYTSIEDPVLLDGGKGCVFVGRSGSEHWLVTPLGRSGPWDGIGGRKVAADGRSVAFVAWRGREVWRKVLPLP